MDTGTSDCATLERATLVRRPVTFEAGEPAQMVFGAGDEAAQVPVHDATLPRGPDEIRTGAADCPPPVKNTRRCPHLTADRLRRNHTSTGIRTTRH